MDEYGVVAGLLGGLFIVWILMIVLMIAIYVIGSLALMKGLKKMGYANPWFAWIPFLCNYALYDCLGDIWVNLIGNVKVPNRYMKIVAVVYPLLGALLGGIPLLNILYMVGFVIVYGWAYKNIFALLKKCPVADVAVLGYVAALIPIIAWVMYFKGEEVPRSYIGERMPYVSSEGNGPDPTPDFYNNENQ